MSHCMVRTDAGGLHHHDVCFSSTDMYDVIILLQKFTVMWKGVCVGTCMSLSEFGTGPSYRSHTWLCIILCASVCVWERNQYMILFILICVCVCPHVLTMHLCVNLHLRVTFFFFFLYSNCFLLSVVSRALAGVLS